MASSDKASFRQKDIEDVWIRPHCVFTLSREVDGHHILGRGYNFGYGTAKPGRKFFSSIYNFIPICRSIHHGPLRDSDECVTLFLRIAREKVLEAIRDGRYEYKKIDGEFCEIADQWIETHGT